MGYIIIGTIVFVGGFIAIILSVKWEISLKRDYKLRCTSCKSIYDISNLQTSSTIKSAVIYGILTKCPNCSKETCFEAVKINQDSKTKS